jgi:hypothetical protein
LVFRSFYKLLEDLDSRHIEYSVILRTFGSDLDRVATDVNQARSTNFFGLRGRFKDRQLFIQESPSQERRIEDISQIYQFFKESSHIAIQDNWEDWAQHNEHQEFGKTVPIDLEDETVLSLFFDDNVKTKPGSVTNVVNPVDIRTGQSMAVAPLVDKKIIFRVDMLEAILDDDYYIRHVNEAIDANCAVSSAS